jgi:hypothetical protein
MPKPKLSPEGEVIAAYGAAMVAAFQVLVSCLEENEASRAVSSGARRLHGMVKSRKGDISDMTLAVLYDIRMATLDSLQWSAYNYCADVTRHTVSPMSTLGTPYAMVVRAGEQVALEKHVDRRALFTIIEGGPQGGRLAAAVCPWVAATIPTCSRGGLAPAMAAHRN